MNEYAALQEMDFSLEILLETGSHEEDMNNVETDVIELSVEVRARKGSNFDVPSGFTETASFPVSNFQAGLASRQYTLVQVEFK